MNTRTKEGFNEIIKKSAIVSGQMSIINFTLAGFGNGIYSVMRTAPAIFTENKLVDGSRQNNSFSKLFVKNFNLMDKRFYLMTCVVIPMTAFTSSVGLIGVLKATKND